MKVIGFIILSLNLQAQNFEYQKEIQIDKKASAYIFDLTQDVYRHVNNKDLSDLRIINASNDSIPMRIINKNDSVDYQVLESSVPLFKMNHTQSTAYTSKLMRTTGSGHSEDYTVATSQSLLNFLHSEEHQQDNIYYIDASSFKNEMIYSFNLDWSFEKSGNRIFYVNVQASNDLQYWQSIKSKQKLLEIQIGNKNILENKIPINSKNYDYYRLVFDEFPSMHLNNVYAGLIDQSIITNHESLLVNEMTKIKKNEVIWNTGGFFNIESIQVDFKQKNLITGVKVFSKTHENDRWGFVGRDSLYSIFYEGIELKNNTIQVKGINNKHWKLIFDENVNNENIESINMSWRPHQIQFMAQGLEPYRMLLGHSQLFKPAKSHWYNRIPQDLRAQMFSDKVHLADEIKQRTHEFSLSKKATNTFDKTNKKQWVFWGLLVLILILLVRMAIKLLAEVKD